MTAAIRALVAHALPAFALAREENAAARKAGARVAMRYALRASIFLL